ncbi:HpcH/HpaI aldolase/citrate lyase family protein [Legionella impletisoli]|uniref:Citrate lyase subunit beta n=1 Tax=Legionella impletisoli TaxID=343510 RepID=A0A917JLS1_9GAMM|nr:CoA ester lyase [Legionella impletisoli]GGI76492.1 citrate lyase subunit beta [Legionella impletisoli]
MLFARCLLFTPANHPERFSKAHELGADGVIIDLEDAISLTDKDNARVKLINYLQNRPQYERFVQCLRINSLHTRAGLKDLTALCDEHVRPDILVLPKSENANEIEIINEILAPHTVPILALIESAKGLQQAHNIADAKNVVGLIFGGADFAADLGATMDWESLYSARAQIVQAAARAGIVAIDVPYLNLHDADDTGIIFETKAIKALGFTCKTAIHPKHIKPIIASFTPNKDEIEKAKAIVLAYETAQGNACEYNGKMIDVPVYRSAKRILELANNEVK